MRLPAAAALLGLLAIGTAAAQDCTPLGRYGQGADSATIHRTAAGLLTFRANMDVNTDGALASYRVDDLGHFLPPPPRTRLQTHTALNSICNGVDIRDRQHRLLYGGAQCGRLIAEFERLRAAGWTSPEGNYVRWYGIARQPDSEARAPNRSRGLPCERDGFYVSQTAGPLDRSRHACDPERYTDSLRIPAIVLPLDAATRGAGAGIHDVVAVRRRPGGPWVGAIVGDTNPNKIGEGTIRLLQELRGTAAVPRNLLESYALALPDPRERDPQLVEYVVFPGSARDLGPLANGSRDAIAAAARGLVDRHRLPAAPLCPAR